MNNYISSKETSRHEYPQHHVEIIDPPTKPGACRKWLGQALMSGQVDTRFQIRRVSKEPGTTNSHVRTNRHGVLVLLASKELGTSVWAKICMFLNVTPRLQQVAGVLLTTTTSSGQGTVTSSIDNRLFGYYNKQWVGYCQQHHDNSSKQENDSDNHNTRNWNQC